MEKTRVKKGEKYWWINSAFEVCCTIESNDYIDEAPFNQDNYFATEESADAVVRKLRAILAGADVIEMPSEEDFERIRPHHSLNMYDETTNGKADGWQGCYRWIKSKIVK